MLCVHVCWVRACVCVCVCVRECECVHVCLHARECVYMVCVHGTTKSARLNWLASIPAQKIQVNTIQCVITVECV